MPKLSLFFNTCSRKFNYKFFIIPIAFLICSCCLWLLVVKRPPLNYEQEDYNVEDGEKVLKFPTCLEDVKKLMSILSFYKENNTLYIYVLFSSAYIFKQTFAIPGSALLNILAGALFGCWPYGLLICSLLTACGASNCFFLSKVSGRELVRYYFPAQVAWLQEKLVENEEQLLLYLISLRLFPATPNWLINIVSPIVNVPLHLFFISVFVGLLPYNFLCIKAGETLAEVDSLDDIFTPKRLLLLLGLAVGVFIISYISKKDEIKLKKI